MASMCSSTFGRSANCALHSSIGWAMVARAVSRSSSRTASRCSRSRRGRARSVSSRSFSSSSIAVCTACCCSAGQALKSAGGTTWPSFIGAMAKPIGVRRMAMPFAVALSRNAFNARSFRAADALFDGAAALLVVLALEHRRQRSLQIGDQPLHRLLQGRRAAGRQRNRHRPMRRGEVVHIHPVGRLRPAARRLLEQGAHRGMDARAIGADGEDVEAAHAHLGTETDRRIRPRLIHQHARRRQLGCGVEAQGRNVGRAVQAIGRQRRSWVRTGHRPDCGASAGVRQTPGGFAPRTPSKGGAFAIHPFWSGAGGAISPGDGQAR